MEYDSYDPEVHSGGIDADAVCEMCSTVNPEDTFLCRNCGNNLREQKARRIAAQAEAEFAGEKIGHGAWLRKGFALIGILSVVLVAVYLTKIEEWLVSAQTSRGENPRTYWRGQTAGILDSMLDELNANPVTKEEADRAVRNAASNSTIREGRYYLTEEGIQDEERPRFRVMTGQAILRNDGGRALIIALFSSGVEIRGVASIEDTNRLIVRDSAGVKLGSSYYAASGVALVNDDEGGIDCFAQYENSAQAYSIIAYYIE